MTKDEVFALAQEAGKHQWPLEPDFLERFAALVAAQEREQIAQILDKQADLAPDDIDRQWAQEMAEAVRERSKT